MNTPKSIGLLSGSARASEAKLIQYINLKLAALGCPTVETGAESEFDAMAANFLLHHRETHRLLADYLCPADQRIQDFLDLYLGETGMSVKVPGRTFVLDHHGLARTLSLPVGEDSFVSDIVSSYRVKQGVLHNPKSDRRTTEGIFHIVEGGLPVPADKTAVSKAVFARMLLRALAPPEELLRLPFTANQKEHAAIFVSLLLRPLVSPEAPGICAEKRMEVRFFAPGNLVSNLDFVESIFGNAGDPYLPEYDAGLDVQRWTGHTGCVILAPHLVRVTKKEAGLPRWEEASERQRAQGMCWKSEEEPYNNGQAFKLACRDHRGVMVTVIADNYFGYCKKEVKTQISYAANLFGGCEEEHAGGALVFPSYNLGEEFSGLHLPKSGHTFARMTEVLGESMEPRPEGYGVDRRHPDIFYVPEDARFDLHRQLVSWPHRDGERSIKLLPGRTYVRPSGYKVHMERPSGDRNWRLVGTVAEPTFCHKPCTVSGGGKSEISKPITDAILQGPVFVTDFRKDFDLVAEILERDYSGRFKDRRRSDSRPILSPKRSLGSVIKLLTPASRDYSPEYNEWLGAIPQYLKELVFVVKRFYKPEWGANWREHFSVDIINGTPGNELKCDNRKLVASYVRVGYEADGSWRTFGLRQDFRPAAKLAQEDDISVSVVAPAAAMQAPAPERAGAPSVKLVRNCEYRLFQRPDEAIHRGYDKQTEADFARPGNFFSNYEPLPAARAKELVEDIIEFEKFTAPMRELVWQVAEEGAPAFFASSAHPRLIDGKPSKNPRYLQVRTDMVNPRDAYLAEVGARLFRRIGPGKPLLNPVNAIVPGRRNNPPDPASGIRPLAVYSPIHYMELPELFMEYICSMTGKSPSTTGAGSEGALTKGPFNALLPIVDLNSALVANLLTGAEGFVTAAGYVGPHCRVDHDISLLIPEIWCRMSPGERDPQFLIRNGYLEKVADFTHQGARVLASRLGYRITTRFVRTYFGRMFNHPHLVFDEAMLRPETQDKAVFVDGMDNIVGTQRRVAALYFEDGSVDQACPPLKALLHVMARGSHEGRELDHPEFRKLFTLECLLASDWYRERLRAKQRVELELWRRNVVYLERFLARKHYAEEAVRLGINGRLEESRAMLARIEGTDYLKGLEGTIGAQPGMDGGGA